MTSLNRIRIILYAIMIFGAFANFAQNEWGYTVMYGCEGMMAVTYLIAFVPQLATYCRRPGRKGINAAEVALFAATWGVMIYLTHGLAETAKVVMLNSMALTLIAFAPLFVFIELIFARVKKLETVNEVWQPFESICLTFFFTGLFFGSLYWKMGALIILASAFFLTIIFIYFLFLFLRGKIESLITRLVTCGLGLYALIMIGFDAVSKILHWVGRDAGILYTGYVALAAVVLIVIKNYGTGKSKRAELWSEFKTRQPNAVLIMCALVVLVGYNDLSFSNLAPPFYSEHLPQQIYKNIYNFKDEQVGIKSLEARLAYEEFLRNCRKNGLIK